MFNRSTKLTALLVAAASIASSVPAMAATKLANKEGTVEHAVSYKDGRYLYEGYRTDDDDKGLYYNAGDKDKKLDDVTEFNGDAFKYDDKYVSAFDGSDEYVVDMSTGKVTDDDNYSDVKDTTETKLQNKLKKTKRYKLFDSNNKEYSDATLGNKVDGSKFGDVWYEYEGTTEGATSATQTKAFGYVNQSGTYIDASHEFNIYAYNNGDMKKIENVGDTENGVTLVDVKRLATIGQDDKYIYALIEAKLSGAKNIAGEDLTTATFVQKVSKTQGDDEKDAYLPKSTDCYQVGLKADLQNGDVEDAYNALKKLVNNEDNAKVAVVDGAIYVSFDDDGGEKVKTVKVQLKTSEKLNKYVKEGTEYKKQSDKVDGHVAKKDGDVDTKQNDWCIDSKGTVWAIYNGEIKKSVKKGSFETVYTCDRSLDRLDVYDENNLIAWDNSGDVYTTVQEGSDEAKKEATEIIGEQPAPVAKTGWQKDATTGTWTLYDAVGTQLTGWQLVGGKYYYMDPSTGVMQTGWVKSPASGKWYYMDPVNGDMKTGWQLVGGKWYYMNPSNGDMQTGWVYDGSNWYYMYSDGSMASNTTIDGYVLNASGAWIN